MFAVLLSKMDLTCNECGVLVKKKKLNRHILTHREATLKCYLCEKSFGTKDSLNLTFRAGGGRDFTLSIIPLKVHINVSSTRQPDIISRLNSMRKNSMPRNKCYLCLNTCISQWRQISALCYNLFS